MNIERIDTTKKLWDYLYRVSLPYQQSRHEEDIRKHGTRVSGIEAYDRDQHNHWYVTMLSVSQMVDFYKEGVPLRISSQADIKEIYESISSHIEAWKERLQRGINIGDAPIEDLILMDQFANTVYEHAKYHFTPETANSLFINHLSGLQRIGVSNFFNSKEFAKRPEETSDDTEDGKMPERDSLADFFKSRLTNLNNWR